MKTDRLSVLCFAVTLPIWGACVLLDQTVLRPLRRVQWKRRPR